MSICRVGKTRPKDDSTPIYGFLPTTRLPIGEVLSLVVRGKREEGRGKREERQPNTTPHSPLPTHHLLLTDLKT
jgi:hypothetical protein